MVEDLVSVITPCYNGEKYIAETIESVISQTYNKWEMIIIDDGSTDKSAEVVSKYMAQDKRIQLLRQRNAGSAAARNTGIRQAKGQYIALLDADDIWLPKFLTRQIDFIKQKNAVCVFCSVAFINSDSKEILKPRICKKLVTVKDMSRLDYIPCLTGLYDISRHGKIYLHEEMKSFKDDYAYFYEIVKLENSAYGNQKILAKYRIRSDSITSNKKQIIHNIYKQYLFYRNFLKQNFICSLFHTMLYVLRGIIKYSRRLP